MNIPHGGGHPGYPTPWRLRWMVRPSVPPATRCLVCQGNAIFLRQTPQQLKEPPVVDGATIHERDHRAQPQGADSHMLRSAGMSEAVVPSTTRAISGFTEKA